MEAVADDLASLVLDARMEQEGFARSSINPFMFPGEGVNPLIVPGNPGYPALHPDAQAPQPRNAFALVRPSPGPGAHFSQKTLFYRLQSRL